MIIICFVCALILSILSLLLKKPQEDAEKLYNSKQLLISAKILNYEGDFTLRQGNEFIKAYFDSKTKELLASKKTQPAKDDQILTVYQTRVLPRLTNDKGDLLTFEEANINQEEYIESNEKTGYASHPYKLLYVILPNLPEDQITKETPVYGYVIPVSGYGLWDAIYGYLCLEADANTIIGTTWYNQKETPGLGGEIGTEEWQKQFYGKQIFKEDSTGSINFKRAVLGIKVVKTTVEQELGNSPASKSAVDGIAGASITIAGVTEAYRQTLSQYRPFLVQAHETYLKQSGK